MTDFLKFWNWFRKADLPVLPEPEPPVITDPNDLEQIELQKEFERRVAFIAEKKQSADTFDWHKGIFSTWSSDVIQNYRLFCANGLAPMKTEELKNFQLALGEILREVSEEIDKRT